MSVITTYCRIKNDSYSVNGKDFSLTQEENLSALLLQLYKSLGIDYAKFHKMDLLAKTAFLGSELIIKNTHHLDNTKDDEVALCFANRESSAYSDANFIKSYAEDGNPSPSHFVYTLPNILLGEIAIKNKWYGENLFLIFPKFDAQEFTEQANVLLATSSKSCLCGWINVTGKELDAFFFLVENNEVKGELLSPENLLKLYNF